MRILSLLSLLLLALSMHQAHAGYHREKDVAEKDDCCPSGKFCFGTTCRSLDQQDDLFDTLMRRHLTSLDRQDDLFDILVEGGCCKTPPPKDDCCPSGKFCCGTTCRSLDQQNDLFCILVEGGCCDTPSPSPKIPVCEQELKVPGPCEAYIPSWSWNPKTHKCEYFIYGGCQGNDNRFETKKDCLKKCKSEQNDCAVILCRPGHYCCHGRCMPKWKAIRKGCLKP